jgi:LAS superfamily LD-carboxypeptidase LdcB
MKKIFVCLIVLSHLSFRFEDKQAITADYLMGKFDPAKHADFCKIDIQYATKPDMYLRKEAYEAFVKMAEAAQKEGLKLSILSATRNFEYQKKIWDVKFERLKDKTAWARVKKILQYSAMPGSSRHHWGTDIDMNNLVNAHFEKGDGKKIYDWLSKNAASYGFCQPYTAGRATGYKEEKWHWSYMPLSKDFTAIAGKYLKNNMIVGFKGAEMASQIDIVNNYILGINKGCY